MSKKKTVGNCSICGNYGQLSFEHLPPRAAFNKATVIQYKLEDVVNTSRKSKGKPKQGGTGAFTLCENCNNMTGGLYGKEYVKWTRNCFDILRQWERHRIS